MKFVLYLSDIMIPLLFFIIIAYGFSKKVPLFDTFILGVKDGFQTVFHIAPTLVGLMVAVGVLRASGALDILSDILSVVTDKLNFPKEALPLTLMRMVSSSAATGLLLDIFKVHGPDSFIGRFVSVMMSCTETIIYTMSIYFMSVKITKTRYTLPAALIANIAGVVASIYITKIAFGY